MPGIMCGFLLLTPLTPLKERMQPAKKRWHPVLERGKKEKAAILKWHDSMRANN